MAQPQLSLCMIVRNEQDMLPGLLASGAGLWDELVVVDTGSADGTVALLEAAGAQVIPHPWQDDFAAARNVSLAAATGRWILFLDADERITPALCVQIRALLADNQAGAATLVLRNMLPGGNYHDANLLRIFRNDPTIRFRHRIHEDVLDDVTAFLAREQLQARHLTGVVEHLGYVRQVAAAKDKQQRDQELLRRVLAEDPTDFYCWFKLLESARFWHDRPLWAHVAEEVAPLLGAGLTDTQRQELKRRHWSGELAALVSEGLFAEAESALNWLEQWREHFQTGVAWHLRRALLLESLERHAAAADAFTRSLSGLDAATEHLRVRILMGQCRLAMSAGDPEQARTLLTSALTAAPTDPEALLAAITLANQTAGASSVSAFVDSQLNQHPAAGTALAEALLSAGQVQLSHDLLAELSAHTPTLALGQLACALILEQDLTLDLSLPQAEADTAFQHWIHIIWQSRRTELMVAFAEHCGPVGETFPWLPDFLAAETKGLKGK